MKKQGLCVYGAGGGECMLLLKTRAFYHTRFKVTTSEADIALWGG